MIYFISGASGTGKTSLVNLLQKKYGSKPWSFHHFDSVGVPSAEEMTREYSSPSGWQEAITYQWINRLANDVKVEKIFIGGQVNLQFIHKGFEKHPFIRYQVILLDCAVQEMKYRLTKKRHQPELFTPEMVNWLSYLRGQANEAGDIIIDTAALKEEDVLAAFEKAVALNG